MRSAALIGILGVLFTTSLLACATDDAGDSAEGMEGNLIGGAATPGARFAAVGAMADEMAGPFCTATLVAPRLIVTAQHCLEGGSEGEPEARKADETLFELGDDASVPKRVVRLKRWLPAPTFDERVRTDYSAYSSDVMLAELSESIDDVAPIPISVTPVAEAEVGHEFDVVGFGVRSEDGRGAVDGKRETGSFKLEAIKGNAFVKRFGSREEFETYYATIDPDGAADGVGERMFNYGELHDGYSVLARSDTSETCFGDSGGPLMRRRGDKLEVVGVVSSGFPGYSSSCLHLGTVFATFGPKTVAFLQQNLPPS